jgi:hypothetical protein
MVYEDVQKADYEFSGLFAYLKHYFHEYVQIALLDDQEVENKFAWPFGTLKHRCIDIKKTAF